MPSKKSFPVGGWVVHKVIIVSVRVLYVGFSISLVLVFRFRVFRFLGFWVFWFSGFQVLRFFGQDGTPGFSDGTGRDAKLDNYGKTTIDSQQLISTYFMIVNHSL